MSTTRDIRDAVEREISADSSADSLVHKADITVRTMSGMVALNVATTGNTVTPTATSGPQRNTARSSERSGWLTAHVRLSTSFMSPAESRS